MSESGHALHILPAWLNWPQTQTLLHRFNEAGVEMRFVGGCVRDALLGREVRDVDIATPASPETVMQALATDRIKVIPTGVAHGTVTAVVDKKSFEITTLRRDIACDGRHAEVEYTDDWLEDASRRDLTINALYLTPQGHVQDYFSGVEDAKAGIIRFIGDANQRIREDALRILRFFRFFAYYGKVEPDAEGLEACLELSHLIKNLSGERIQTEMLKTLNAPDPLVTLMLMNKAGVLAEVEMAQIDLNGLRQLIELEKDYTSDDHAIRRLALLLRSLGDKTSFERLTLLADRWRLSNAHRAQLKLLLSLPSAELSGELFCKRQIRLHGRENTMQALLIAAAESRLDAETLHQHFALARDWSVPVFPVTGDDLKKLGIKPGKAFGKTLDGLEAQWEKSNYMLNKEELLKQLKGN